MILVDHEIRAALNDGRLAIHPTPPDSCFQPNSVDLTLGKNVIHFRRPRWWQRLFGLKAIRPKMNAAGFMEITERRHYKKGESLVMRHGDFLLVDTVELIATDKSSQLCIQIGGKSSPARIGLFVHLVAGFFDSGWTGVPTLELYYVGQHPLELFPGIDKVCQIQIWRTSSVPDRPYGAAGLGSHYQHSMDVRLPVI